MPEERDEEEICDEEWLAHFRLYGQKGHFRHEPDFPQALREYEEAIAEAKRDPAHLPPAEFMPQAPEVRRRRYWREGTTERAVQQGLLWLCAMYGRVMDGIPAVTIAEWEMLTTWLQEQREQIQEWSVEVDDDRMTVPEVIEALERMDARDADAGKYAMILRQLYSRHARRNIQTNNSPEAGSEAC